MKSKSEIKQILMRSAVKTWGLKSIDQLDPVVKLFIEGFCELIYLNENSIEDIRERLLEQIAASLTPDHLIAAKPAHSVMRVKPAEPEMEIDRKAIFYTSKLNNTAIRHGLKTIQFAPVTNHIKLSRGEISSLLCERNLYRIGVGGEKDLLTRASSFYQDLNRTVYIGLNLDEHIPNLRDIHFYVDFENTESKYELYDLLIHTTWSIAGHPLQMETGLAGQDGTEHLSGGIFAHYNVLQMNDEEVMDLYRKQFLHIKTPVRTSTLEKTPFPTELTPFFPERVKALEPQLWIKVVFPPYFKTEQIDDINIHLNVFPVSNKDIRETTLFRNESMTGIIPLPVQSGEYYLAMESVGDSSGNEYKFLPYTISEVPLGGTYTIKRGGCERFSTRNLNDMIDQFIDLLRSELVTFIALKIDNISNSVSEMEQIISSIKDKLNQSNSKIKENPTYLLIDTENQINLGNINACYWITNCDLANNIAYGTAFGALNALPLEKDTCFLLRASSGGKTMPKKEEMLAAYKHALSTRDQLFSARDIENFCYMKFPGKIQSVKVSRGIQCSQNPKEGLVRCVDTCILPIKEYKELFDSVTLGELKLELEKRSPQIYKYRILVQEDSSNQKISSNNLYI